MKPLALTHKVNAVARVQQLMKSGQSQRAACAMVGIAQSSYQCWEKKVKAGGEAALKADYSGCGRPAKFELSETEERALRGLVLMSGSVTWAVEHFARTHADCRHETREAIFAELDIAAREKRYARWPVSVHRAANVTPEEKASFRGSKHMESISFSPRKGLFFVDEAGRNVPLTPHAVWVMDDYSTNQPYWIDTEDEAKRLCRQTLAAMDVASDAWLSVEMIGRERDQYRAEDILRFILRTIDAQGTMPLYLLLERGRWESSAVHGLDLKCVSPKYEGRTWGGLDELFGIIHGFSSRHKAMLESSFNILQRALAHSGREIGRVRGEFEAATKDYLAIQNQARLIERGGTPRKLIDPAERGFLSMDEAREAHWKAMQYLNGRGKHRAATGTVEVPNDLLSMCDVMRPLPECERWRFLPIKRIGTVRGGFVEASVAPYKQPFRFQINGLPDDTDLPSGYRVLYAFDPAMPEMGAYVCNGEVGAANRDGYRLGEYLKTAPNGQDAPQFDLRGGGYKDSSKRRASTRARTSFAAINPMGRRGLAVTAQHDGQGNASIARTGASKASDGMAIISAPAAAPEDGRSEMGDRDNAPKAAAPRRAVMPVESTEEMEARALEALGFLG